MKILMTGGTGFIGGALVKRLAPEHELFCLVRKGGTLPSHPHIHAVQQDLGQSFDLNKFPRSVDAVVHLAQSKQFRKFPDEARDIFHVNTDATAQLLEYGRSAKSRVFLLASSGGVCGYQSRPILETDPPDLMNFYLASKYAAECLVSAYGEYFSTVILRYFFVYGEGQRDMFIPSLLQRIRDGKPVQIHGKTGVAMNPIHLSDAVEATARALELTRSEVVNVAGGEETNVLEIAQMIGEVVGRVPVFGFEPDKGSMAMVANIEKMRLKLGVAPKVSLKEGLERVGKDLLGMKKGPSK